MWHRFMRRWSLWHTHHRPGGLIAYCQTLLPSQPTTPRAETHFHRLHQYQFRQHPIPTAPNRLQAQSTLTAGYQRLTLAARMTLLLEHSPKAHLADYAAPTRHTWSSAKIRQISKMPTNPATFSSALYSPALLATHPITMKLCV